MESLSQIPRWFWITLAAVVAITILAVVYCNKQKIDTAEDISQSFNSGKTDVFDNVQAINMMMA